MKLVEIEIKQSATKEAFIMTSLHSVILAILIFSFTSGVYADKGKTQQSPESILTCIDLNGVSPYLVWAPSIPSEIDAGQCRTRDVADPMDLCASCIASLEAQGCKIIDVEVLQVEPPSPEALGSSRVTYLLSCSEP